MDANNSGIEPGLISTPRELTPEERADKLACILQALEIEFDRVGATDFNYGPQPGEVGLNWQDSQVVSTVIRLIDRKFPRAVSSPGS